MQVLDAKSSSLSHSPTICEPGSSDLSGRQGRRWGGEGVPWIKPWVQAHLKLCGGK